MTKRERPVNAILSRLATPDDWRRKERTRIRQAIAPHKLIAWSAVGHLKAAGRAEIAYELEAAIHYIDAATSAPRKTRTR